MVPTTTVQSDSLKTTKPNKKPADRYSCNINDQGFCIFTGQPHQNYLKPRSRTVVNIEGLELFSIEEAVAVNSQGEMLIARGTPAFDGDQMSQKAQAVLSEDEKAFHRVIQYHDRWLKTDEGWRISYRKFLTMAATPPRPDAPGIGRIS